MTRRAQKLLPIAAALLLAGTFEPAAAQRPDHRARARATSTASLSISTRFGNPRSYSRSRSYGNSCQRRTWIPGRWESVPQRHWVEERVHRRWVPDRYETRHQPCGTPYRVLIQAGHWAVVREPGYWTTRHVRVWRPGHWS